jgi:hypothetical protein
VRSDEKTEPEVAPRPGEGPADTLSPLGEDATEQQSRTASDDPTAPHPPPFTEQPTIALPEALPPTHDPPTVVLPGELADSFLDATEQITGAAETHSSPKDPPTVVEVTGKRAAPALIPGYQLLERLGSGTYGEVWLAQDERTGIRVAVKFLHHATDVEWQLIQAEVKQLALLHADPGIVQLLDVELDRLPPYYIMAYAEQGSLAKRLESAPVPLAEALEIFRQLAEALAYVHAKGVRHCDLKPGNILLKARKRALIGDFGQSHLFSEQAPALGTFFYMAPEQAQLAKQIPDTRWDVYGLGAIFYAMLTGEAPRDDVAVRERLAATKNLAERLEQYRSWVENAPRPDLHRKVPGMDRHIADIIDQCLEVSPVRRLRDAGAVLSAIARRDRMLRQRPLLILGFLAQVLLCLVLGSLGYLGVHIAIQRTEASLLQQLEPGDPTGAALVRQGMSDLRGHLITVGIIMTGAVTLILSALWGWLIWRLRRKEKPEPGEGW